MSDLLLVMSKGQVDREGEYRHWYAMQHLPDMKRVPGVADGKLFRVLDADETTRWTVAARYSLEAPIDSVLGAVFSRAGGGEMPLTDAIDDASVLMLGATPIGSRVVAEDQPDRNDGAIYIVLTNATAGDDDVFNAWYNDQHVPDVLAVPGFIAAQRFAIAPETAGKPSPWRYLSLYELAPETQAAAMAELQARAGGEKMPLSSTLSTTDVYATLFSLAA